MSSESRTSLYHEFDPVDVVALTMIDGFGPATTRAHLERIRSESRPIDDGLTSTEWKARRSQASAALRKAGRVGARCLIDGDPQYPPVLHDLESPPVALWVMGDIGIAHDRVAISIVGTRRCSVYGERVTRQFGNAFVQAGATVVSGMATGIDAMAHIAALESSGDTVAVLGTGIDVPYPASHRALHRRIAEKGLVISEGPPGLTAVRGCFPRRNRVIAALGAGTIVVEAGVRSGALDTAGKARDLGRALGVVPGPIDAPSSLGSNILMRDGAHPLTSVEDALALVGLSAARRGPVTFETPQEERVWRELKDPAPDFDVLCARTGLPVSMLVTAVATLEMRGLVLCGLTGEVRRR